MVTDGEVTSVLTDQSSVGLDPVIQTLKQKSKDVATNTAFKIVDLLVQGAHERPKI